MLAQACYCGRDQTRSEKDPVCRLRCTESSTIFSYCIFWFCTLPKATVPQYQPRQVRLMRVGSHAPKCPKPIYLQSYFVILSSLFEGHRAANLCYWSDFNPLFFFVHGVWWLRRHKTSLSAMSAGGVGCALKTWTGSKELATIFETFRKAISEMSFKQLSTVGCGN